MPTNGGAGRQIGVSLPRLEARAKVTGRAEYTHTMQVPGMVHGKVFRSTVAHGRIKRIDVSAAARVPGVIGAFTGEDIRKVIPDPYYGPASHEHPFLAASGCLLAGEPVPAVVATDPHIAEAAVAQIVAEYEEMPAV